MSYDTILSFPRRFNSNTDPADLNSGLYLLQRLWANSWCEIRVDAGEFYPEIRSRIDDEIIVLPESFDIRGGEGALVKYLQKLMMYNSEKYIVVYHGVQPQRGFEIVTREEFLAKLEYPIEEYKACEMLGGEFHIIHPNLPFTRMIVAGCTAEMFTSGCMEDFDSESVCYKTYCEYME